MMQNSSSPLSRIYILILSLSLLLSCNGRREKQVKKELEIKAKWIFVEYQVDYNYFEDSTTHLKPFGIDLYFAVLNNTDTTIALDLKEDQNGTRFYLKTPDSLVITLKTSENTVTVLPDDSVIVIANFPHQDFDLVKDAFYDNNINKIATSFSEYEIYFRNPFKNNNFRIDYGPDTYTYFMFSDTSITCFSNGSCHPFIDPATMWKKLPNL